MCPAIGYPVAAQACGSTCSSRRIACRATAAGGNPLGARDSYRMLRRIASSAAGRLKNRQHTDWIAECTVDKVQEKCNQAMETGPGKRKATIPPGYKCTAQVRMESPIERRTFRQLPGSNN